jgi:hypothetical protein
MEMSESSLIPGTKEMQQKLSGIIASIVPKLSSGLIA